jgi:hypothetical protein
MERSVQKPKKKGNCHVVRNGGNVSRDMLGIIRASSAKNVRHNTPLTQDNDATS